MSGYHRHPNWGANWRYGDWDRNWSRDDYQGASSSRSSYGSRGYHQRPFYTPDNYHGSWQYYDSWNYRGSQYYSDSRYNGTRHYSDSRRYGGYRHLSDSRDYIDSRNYSDSRRYNYSSYEHTYNNPMDEPVDESRAERRRSPEHSQHSSVPYVPPPLFARKTPVERSPPRTDKPEPVLSPSPSYLELASQSPTTLTAPTSTRKLLILDLNGTLVLRSPHRQKGRTHFPAQPRLRPVHPRPYMRAFTEYLFAPRTRAWLDVMVWSSAQPHSVADMVAHAFGARRDALVAVWARDTLGLTEDAYRSKVQTVKDLSKPWAQLPALLTPLLPSAPAAEAPPHSEDPTSAPEPARTHVHSALTTLLLDDSPLKAVLQPFNHVCIPEYTAALRAKDLQGLQQEQDWALAQNVRAQLNADEDGGEAARVTQTEEEVQQETVFERTEQMEFSLAAMVESTREGDPPLDTTSPVSNKRKRRAARARDLPEPPPDHNDAADNTNDNAGANLSPQLQEEAVSPSTPASSLSIVPVSSQPAAASDSGADTRVKQERKRKSKKQKRIEVLAQTAVQPAPAYDATLLAVVGVLEAAKTQANVAAWVHAGGLWGPGGVPDVCAAAEKEEASETGATERSGVDEGWGAGNDAVTTKDSTGSDRGPREGRTKQEAKAEGYHGDVSPVDAPTEATEARPALMWFEREESLMYWSAQGRKALEELGIPVEHGLER
ncbi:hypothetical protein WOLCODRAFT_139474 [Wolfiporia cocos MD-104 SS10]|uniref:FCP1 homology domain-containing protein n=1 Tax=Wolfiporia cocos (strain MD-104) TaxID=742152 RepID=A0A2H3JAD2_WOLCO|nr:hypothetical protein WOLCODRAFT_139474 [Wolfiporia cocos MD-104 SS10]